MITFGIWPGVVGTDLVTLTGPIDVPPEDVPRTGAALRELAGESDRFYVRCYRSHGSTTNPDTPADPAPYLGDGRVIDLVLGYGAPGVDDFAAAARAAVGDVAALGGGKLQIAEEVNVGSPQDGGRPDCYPALAAGLGAALAERDATGTNVLIGFNAAAPRPDDPFWTEVPRHVAPDILSMVDFFGVDFFPDVFAPIPEPRLRPAVAGLLTSVRDKLTEIGVPRTVPIHITETGWPTGPEHGEERQAEVLGAVAETVCDNASRLNIDTYEIFGLRDGLTTGPRTNRFGLLRDDHTAKPAFGTIRNLIDRYGRLAPAR